MRTLGTAAALGLVAVSSVACGQQAATQEVAAEPTATVTVTVTRTVTAFPSPDVPFVTADPADDAADPSAFHLTVYRDGCGVIRTAGEDVNLTWSIVDTGGFQVAGVNATAMERYRYYQGGHFSVVLTAFHDGAYRPVSNTVQVDC